MQYYVAADISLIDKCPLHATIAFLGPKTNDWAVLNANMYALPLPFEVTFDHVVYLGPNADIEAVHVTCTSPGTDKALRQFHHKHVMPGHISENKLVLHVTSKGHSAELLEAERYTVHTLRSAVVGHKSSTNLIKITK